MYKYALTYSLIFLLTACSFDSLSEDAAGHYKVESPLQVDILLPEPVLLHEPQFLNVILVQNGKPVNGLDDVQFTVWKNGSPDSNEVMMANRDGRGQYYVEKTFIEEGLYYVKVQASSNGSTIMPTKQFIVGELSEKDLLELQKGHQAPKQSHENHH
ncbi:FixH family protein [Ammoniphilus sp. CFH 90114]|uniref:FixH family protein n=1 Tax=Ammoniphilus sp. CFH 90114 TaxID=2493665 RepID=UPI001F0C1234|nr:FixH family protein [Ammoniphilus sp. CFH 90114]